MAAVTINSVSQRHVLGDLVYRTYNISGPSGSTFTFPQTNVQFIDQQTSTGATPPAQTVVQSWTTPVGVGGAASQSQITITSSAPMVNEIFQVVSRVG